MKAREEISRLDTPSAPDATGAGRGDGSAGASGVTAADTGGWLVENDERVATLDAKIAEVKRAHRARLRRPNAERDALVRAVEGEHMRAELERLRAENASLRARGSDAPSAPAPSGAVRPAGRGEAVGATRRRRPQTRPRARLRACRGSPLAAGALAPGSEARRGLEVSGHKAASRKTPTGTNLRALPGALCAHQATARACEHSARSARPSWGA